ncbi:hypothetical protein KW797_01925 [Candidatus Parcubacteria bacterium]|nr:hypothetical protein [Candidatus Parcubacteria bacterium]
MGDHVKLKEDQISINNPALTVDGNGVLICVTCRGKFDKGAPPKKGQDDSHFKCEGCQDALDKAALEERAKTEVGLTTVSGS